MKELITIHPNTPINNRPIPTVSARDLHRFMEVGRDFSSWIKGRVEEFDYEEGRDFVVVSGFPVSVSGADEWFSPDSAKRQRDFSPVSGKTPTGRPSVEYYITLDMAKELAMVERNPMGRLARKYFIRCEQAVMETLPALREEVLRLNPRLARLQRYRRMGLTRAEICRLLGCGQTTVHNGLARLRAMGLLEVAPPRRRQPSGSEHQLPLFGEVAR